MQPYFIPYAGYYRLFAGADLFVALDTVQFPRRGWVHRNKLADQNGNLQWLTIPLKKGDRDKTQICDLEFQDNAGNLFKDTCRRFSAVDAVCRKYPNIATFLFNLTGSPVDYFISLLNEVNAILGIKRPVIRSSALDVGMPLNAQDRILSIALHVGATTYINAPGGRALYDSAAFREAQIELKFLSEYNGSYASILERLAFEDAGEIVNEISKNSVLLES